MARTLPADVEQEIRTRLSAAFPQPNTVDIVPAPFIRSTYLAGFVALVQFAQGEKVYAWRHMSTTMEWVMPESRAGILAHAERAGAMAQQREAVPHA